MKRTCLFSVILSLCIGQTFAQSGKWTDHADTGWYGTGEESGYTISSAEELAGLTKLVDQGNTFKGITLTLAGDIDLDAHFWAPIGFQQKAMFQGILDGDNHSIKNIHVGQDSEYPDKDAIAYKSAGLFGYIAEGARIMNLTLTGGEVVGMKNNTTANYTISTGGFAGMVVCASNTDTVIFSNCHNEDVRIVGGFDYSKDHDLSYVGGLLGYSFGYIIFDNCSNHAAIRVDGAAGSPDSWVGGIAGRVKGGFELLTCENTGDISCERGVISGLLGSSMTLPSRVNNSYCKASLTSPSKERHACYGFGLINNLFEQSDEAVSKPLIIENSYSDNVYDFNGEAIVFTNAFDSRVIRNCYMAGDFTTQTSVSNSLSQAAEISNCLYINNHRFIAGEYDDSPYDLFFDLKESIETEFTTTTDSLAVRENNFSFVNGCPIPSGKFAQDWSGQMKEAPIAAWDQDVWEIDPDNKTLPTLKSFPNAKKTANPLSEQPEDYYTILIPNYTGLMYVDSTYQVKKGKSFLFAVEASNRNQQFKALTQDGDTIPIYYNYTESSYGDKRIYILDAVAKDIEISFEGEGIHYNQSGHWQEYANTDWFKDAADKTYTITTAEEFAGFAKLVNEGHTFADTTFILNNALDLKLHYWDAAGVSADSCFQGIFDGQDHVINNLYATTGLFGYLGDGAQIRNLRLGNGEVKYGSISHVEYGMGYMYDYTDFGGGIAGVVNSKTKPVIIHNCHNNNVDVTGCAYYSQVHTYIDAHSSLGGLIGTVTGTIYLDSCSSSAGVYAGDHTGGEGGPEGIYRWGGLVGNVTGTFAITNSGNAGSVVSNGYTGGLIGYVTIYDTDSSQITASYNAGILGGDEIDGGLIGAIFGTGEDEDNNSGVLTITNCYNSTDDDLIGSLGLGTSSSIIVKNNYVVSESHRLFGHASGNKQYADISNNLVVTTGTSLTSHRLITDTTGVFSLGTNYAFTNGYPLEDNGTGMNGITWDGNLNSEPIVSWDPEVWEVDKSNQYMPTLKNMPEVYAKQPQIPNPLAGFSYEFVSVTLPKVNGITTTYKPGTYKVLSGTDFVFQIIADKSMDISNMTVETDNGTPISRYMDSYIVKGITQPTQIVINGVKVGIEDVQTNNKVWANDQAIHVELLEPEKLTIYSMVGQLMREETLPAGGHTIPMQKGIYIVRLGNETHKMLVE